MKLKIFELIEFILRLLIFVDVMAGYVSSKTCIGWICERINCLDTLRITTAKEHFAIYFVNKKNEF